MHRPKKEFIPTSLSDLNIDAISLGSNSDRHNNNSNGARNAGLSNLSRSKATSSFNLASHNKKAPLSRADSNFSRSSKLYGSQSNISTASSVNNYQINSPTPSTTSPLDRWEKAWEENNNNYRPESIAQQQQPQHSFSKHVSQSKSFSSFSQNQSSATSNRSQNHYVDDPFDDPWSGITISSSNVSNLLHTSLHNTKIHLFKILFYTHYIFCSSFTSHRQHT
jgi:hypothetical protein